jgi:hypothetical protein
VTDLVQSLMGLSDRFSALGPQGQVFQALCNAQIEALKLIKFTDLADLNSASEGLAEIAKDLESFLADSESQTQGKTETQPAAYLEFSYIELPVMSSKSAAKGAIGK